MTRLNHLVRVMRKLRDPSPIRRKSSSQGDLRPVGKSIDEESLVRILAPSSWPPATWKIGLISECSGVDEFTDDGDPRVEALAAVANADHAEMRSEFEICGPRRLRKWSYFPAGYHILLPNDEGHAARAVHLLLGSAYRTFIRLPNLLSERLVRGVTAHFHPRNMPAGS